MNEFEKKFKDFYRQYHEINVNKVIDESLVFKFQPRVIKGKRILGFIMLCMIYLYSEKSSLNNSLFIIVATFMIINFVIDILAKYTIYFEKNKMIIKRFLFEKKIELGNVMQIRVVEKYDNGYNAGDQETFKENRYEYQILVREKGEIEYIKILSIIKGKDIELAKEFIDNFVLEKYE